MATAAVKTQGTTLWYVKPGATPALVMMTCPTGITGIGAGAAAQIPVPCLGNTGDPEMLAGAGQPGQIPVPFSLVPSASSQRDLFALRESGEVVPWIVGLSDGTAAPTLTSGNVTLPATRTFIRFDGYVADLSIDISSQSIVTGNLSIQRSGSVVWSWKT